MPKATPKMIQKIQKKKRKIRRLLIKLKQRLKKLSNKKVLIAMAWWMTTTPLGVKIKNKLSKNKANSLLSILISAERRTPVISEYYKWIPINQWKKSQRVSVKCISWDQLWRRRLSRWSNKNWISWMHRPLNIKSIPWEERRVIIKKEAIKVPKTMKPN